MLVRRVLAALVGGPVFLALVYLGGWPLTAMVALLIFLGLSEYANLIRRWGGKAPLTLLFLIGLLPLVIGSLMGPGAAAQTPVVSLAAALFLPVFAGGDGGGYTVVDGAFLFLGAAYIGLLFPYISYLRAEGLYAIAMLIAPTWVGDTAAYFTGIRWGRRPLLPRVSPKKTVEGAVAGLAGSALAGWAVAFIALHHAWQGLAAGLVVGLVGQVGDLAESALKRHAGVKDSGGLIPGHGGVLDRFDSMIAAAPALYFLLSLFGWGVR